MTETTNADRRKYFLDRQMLTGQAHPSHFFWDIDPTQRRASGLSRASLDVYTQSEKTAHHV